MSEGVFEKYRIATYKEASWKPYIIAAMIVARKFSAPGAALEGLIKEAQNASNNGLAGREISPALPSSSRNDCHGFSPRALFTR